MTNQDSGKDASDSSCLFGQKPTEIKVHEYGFVRLIEVQGSDQLIEDAARLSYGKGTRKTSETKQLLRYLMRHRHTSPFEMGGVVFHIKLPIFVMRQLVRHRTASLNEYSARYSELSDQYYLPSYANIQPQSKTNKQGRDGEFDEGMKTHIALVMDESMSGAQSTYKALLEEGLTRELARCILPMGNYTECYWKINLHNLFHFLALRTDPHAQQEIQDFANAMKDLAAPHFPISFEAWEDYTRGAKTLSKLDQELLKILVKDPVGGLKTVQCAGNEGMAKQLGMSKREVDEFMDWFYALTGEYEDEK